MCLLNLTWCFVLNVKFEASGNWRSSSPSIYRTSQIMSLASKKKYVCNREKLNMAESIRRVVDDGIRHKSCLMRRRSRKYNSIKWLKSLLNKFKLGSQQFFFFFWGGGCICFFIISDEMSFNQNWRGIEGPAMSSLEILTRKNLI